MKPTRIEEELLWKENVTSALWKLKKKEKVPAGVPHHLFSVSEAT